MSARSLVQVRKNLAFPKTTGWAHVLIPTMITTPRTKVSRNLLEGSSDSAWPSKKATPISHLGESLGTSTATHAPLTQLHLLQEVVPISDTLDCSSESTGATVSSATLKIDLDRNSLMSCRGDVDNGTGQDTAPSSPTIDVEGSTLVFSINSSEDGPWLKPRRTFRLCRSRLPRVVYMYNTFDGRVERLNTLAADCASDSAFISGSHGEETEADDLDAEVRLTGKEVSHLLRRLNKTARKNQHHQAQGNCHKPKRGETSSHTSTSTSSNSSVDSGGNSATDLCITPVVRRRRVAVHEPFVVDMDALCPVQEQEEDGTWTDVYINFPSASDILHTQWGSYMPLVNDHYSFTLSSREMSIDIMARNLIAYDLPDQQRELNPAVSVPFSLENVKKKVKQYGVATATLAVSFALPHTALITGCMWGLSAVQFAISHFQPLTDPNDYSDLPQDGHVGSYVRPEYGPPPSNWLSPLETVTDEGAPGLTLGLYKRPEYWVLPKFTARHFGPIYVVLAKKLVMEYLGQHVVEMTLRRMVKSAFEIARKTYTDAVLSECVINTVCYAACVMQVQISQLEFSANPRRNAVHDLASKLKW